MSIMEVWRDAMYEGAVAMWPALTPHQFGEAARAWLERQPAGSGLTLQLVAVGIEQELRDRYGPPT